MNNKLNTLISAILFGLTNVAVSGEPPVVPSIYANGPIPFQLAVTDLRADERAVYALFEGAIEAAEGLIYSTSCSSAVGTYTFDVFANGANGDPESNQIKVISPGNQAESLVLRAKLSALVALRGQNISVEQFGKGSLSGAEVTDFLSGVFINQEGNQMISDSSVNVRGRNGEADTFQSKMIKNFYLASDSNDHHIYDWGLQSLSKLDFPVEKYWQRSKSLRDNGVIGRTVLVKDRLVGASPCRIVIDGSRSNNQNLFSQSGTLTISTETPNDPIPAFDAF